MRGSGERRLSPSVCSFDGETTMKWRERESVAVWAEEEDDERERDVCLGFGFLIGLGGKYQGGKRTPVYNEVKNGAKEWEWLGEEVCCQILVQKNKENERQNCMVKRGDAARCQSVHLVIYLYNRRPKF